MPRKLSVVAIVLLGLGVVFVPLVTGAATTRRFTVTLSTTSPVIDCATAADPVSVPVTLQVQIRAISPPTYVAASYVGGPDVLLGFQSANGNTHTYGGSVPVPKGLICDDPSTPLLFRGIATNGPIIGQGSFAVQAAGAPSEQHYPITVGTSSFPGEAGTGVVDCTNTATSFNISATARINTAGIGRPTSVTLSVLGGGSVTMPYAFAQGATVGYRGTISVPRAFFCDHPPAEVFFQVLATRPGASGAASFIVRSVAPENPPGEYTVSAAATPPQVNCDDPAATFTITVNALVSFKNLELPDTVVAQYAGGVPVTLSLVLRAGYLGDYVGTIQVPRELLCDAPPSQLTFTATATGGPKSSTGTFYVNSVGAPSANVFPESVPEDQIQQQQAEQRTVETTPASTGKPKPKVPATTPSTANPNLLTGAKG